MSFCATCVKSMGNFKCRGCGQDFCMKDANEHRQQLGVEMDKIMVEHDQLKECLVTYTNNPLSHPLMEEIGKWEEESIRKIHQIATESRRQLQDVVIKWKDIITENLKPITEELKKSRDDDTFIEPNFVTWNKKLEELKTDLTAPPTVKIIKEIDDTSYISKLLVFEISNDIFEESVGNINVEDNGKLITHGILPSFGAVRGKGMYSTGCYRFQFKLESLSVQQQNFFGIVSQNEWIQANPSYARSTYGWTDDNSVFLNGIKHKNYKNYEIDMKKNDVLELLLSCDQKRIRLKNTRTDKKHEITIDETKCPLPWQLYFSLGYWADSVRLLST